eukprot:scaffold3581_cov417-Prasinococcus_capsulatus_cf.AAC.3
MARPEAPRATRQRCPSWRACSLHFGLAPHTARGSNRTLSFDPVGEGLGKGKRAGFASLATRSINEWRADT